MFAKVIIFFMLVLLLWAIANIVYWFAKGRNKTNNLKYYWQMNALWNVINLIIALIALSLVAVYFNSYNNNLTFQKINIWFVAVNILLDLSYVAIGMLLENRGKKTNSSKFTGWGLSVQIQGAFLFLFDSILCLALLVVII